MNGPGDISLNSISSETICKLAEIIPSLGMASCRGRAEAFARRLSSKLRTLNTSEDDVVLQEDEPLSNEASTGAWTTPINQSETEVTHIQPLRNEMSSLFNFDCTLESPGSPVDYCEGSNLLEAAQNTPHNIYPESGFSSSVQNVGSSNEMQTSCLQAQQVSSPLANTSESNETATAETVHSLLKIKSCNNESCNQIINSTQSKDPQDCDNKTISTTQGFKLATRSNNSEISSKALKTENSESSFVGATLMQDFSYLQFTNSSDETQSEIHYKHNSIKDFNEAGTSSNLDKYGEIYLGRSCDMTITKLKTTATVQTKKNSLVPDSLSDEKCLSAIDTTDDEDECKPQRIRRCSSLKTGKTPPGTPGRKKIVRFADVLGLDLADVKTFLDEIPTIPKSAFEDLEFVGSETSLKICPKADKLLMPLFQQPGGLPTFLDLVREKQVSLENAAVTDYINHTITGSVRVRNIDFHKSVHIRYSLDNWRSYADLQANYVEKSCDGFSDKFAFTIFGNSLHIGQRLEFAIRFQCKGRQFWDNNFGTNYCFQCLPSLNTPTDIIKLTVPAEHTNKTTDLPTPTVSDSWCTSFY